MKASEVASSAEELLAAYKELLLIDPFYRISIEPAEGDYVSECKPDSSALSWKIRLNPSRHNDIFDVKYSVVDGLLKTMFAEVDRAAKRDGVYLETRDAVLARLTTILCNLLPPDGSDTIEETATSTDG